MPTGNIVSYNPSAGFGFIRPERAPAQTPGGTPQDQAVDADLVLFHDEARVEPASWRPCEGLRVRYEDAGRREDLYVVVHDVAPETVEPSANPPEGTMTLDDESPASYSSEAAY